MAAGFAVCGFGGGSLAFAQTQNALILHVGVPLTLVIHGCIFFVVMFPCSFILRTPPNGYQSKFENLPKAKVVLNPETGEKFTFRQALKTPKFITMWFGKNFPRIFSNVSSLALWNFTWRYPLILRFSYHSRYFQQRRYPCCRCCIGHFLRQFTRSPWLRIYLR
jgi:hypothetical protein